MRRLPTTTLRPSTSASTPCPASALKPDISLKVRPRVVASAQMASPSGCSLPFSTEAARRSNSVSVTGDPWAAFESRYYFRCSDPAITISVTAGWPFVIVPVLSRTTDRNLAGAFQRFAVAEQDAQLGAFARSDHHGGRRGQTHGARTGDHQHRDHIDQGDE